jgi:hypothetical protein
VRAEEGGMTKQQRMYFLCKERGKHEFRVGMMVIDSIPQWCTCSDCGTTFHTIVQQNEGRTPFGWNSDPQTKDAIAKAKKEWEALAGTVNSDSPDSEHEGKGGN